MTLNEYMESAKVEIEDGCEIFDCEAGCDFTQADFDDCFLIDAEFDEFEDVDESVYERMIVDGKLELCYA